jgi:hypothetical protein
LVTFAGYLGPVVLHGARAWRLLYLDRKLRTWLLVLDAEIVFHERSYDLTAAFQMRDVIWVQAHASVGRGSGGDSPREWFLRGSFTDAGDFTVRPTGGTYAPASGIDALTPECCGRPTRP